MSQIEKNIAPAAAQDKARAGKKAASPQGPATPPRAAQGARPVVTFDSAARICPNEGVATKIVSRFGMEAVDYHAVREATEQHLAQAAKALADNLNEKAMQMHMQRIVDAFVRSAHGAGNFYDAKAAQARDLTSKVANADRDEDRPGIDNTANRAERACEFAAEVGLQAYALLAAAHGAVDAYAHVTGQDWKPYEGNTAPSRQVDRQAAAARVSAFDRD